ncbi:MAG: hypothetical protein QOJ99_4925 [Bryobacterales bacterium]|jgi:Cu(I)-responsive transcriptional regulator|nr:hypothetical protein [Bryobacterales bacterium]
MKRVSIGEVTKATAIKAVTIRYYEKIGLFPPPARTGSNYRAYTTDHLRQLRFIRRCRDLGFTLDQVRELLRLSSQKNSECSNVDRLTARHLTNVEQKISDLEKLAGELRHLSKCCKGGGIIADCRILQALAPGEAAP